MTTHALVLQAGAGGRVLVARATQDAPVPAGHVAIDVAYSGVNFADVVMKLGMYRDAPPLPFVPGYEVSGVIAALGDGVAGIHLGDRVVAGTYFGGYASRVVLPVEQVFALPADLSLAEGAALPVAFFTAQMVLGEMGRVRAGDRVLLDAATGGVGVVATKMAVALGATVMGLTTTPGKKPFIEAMGAKAYTHDEFEAAPHEMGFDLILNSAGGASIRRQARRLAIGGRIVCIGMSSAIVNGKRSLARMAWMALQMPRASVLSLFGTSTGIFALNALTVMRDPVWMKRLAAAFAQFSHQGIRPHVGAEIPWRDAARALTMLERKQATGKVVLAWASP